MTYLRGEESPTAKQLQTITRMCMGLGIHKPLEEQMKSQAEAGRMIRELAEEVKYRRNRRRQWKLKIF